MDEILGRHVPYSAEAEAAVIGSCLIDPNCLGGVSGILRAEDFYIQANREIYETLVGMAAYSMSIDHVTVLDRMRVNGVFSEERSPAYLLELIQVTPTSANVMEYAEIVREQALLRNLAQAATEISTLALEGTGGVDAILEAAERKIYALRQGRNIMGLTPVTSILSDVFKGISDAAESSSSIPGLPTGLRDLDGSILGLNRGDLILIASRPGMGKTSIALNIALHVGIKASVRRDESDTGKKSGTVAIFSLEMTKEQLVLRLLSSLGRVDSKKLLTGRLGQDDWTRIGNAAGEISRADIRIDDNSTLTVMDMIAQCRRIKNLVLVVVDYLQLMQSAGGGNKYSNENRQQAVSDMSRMLKIMAKELNVPVICLSQLSRANEARGNKRPLLSDLRESGAIEQDADIVVGLYRDGYYNEESENPNLAEAIILKNRHGETDTIKLMWLPEYTTYANYERTHGDEDEY